MEGVLNYLGMIYGVEMRGHVKFWQLLVNLALTAWKGGKGRGRSKTESHNQQEPAETKDGFL